MGQFMVAGFALAQFAFAWSQSAQIGAFLHDGRGMLVVNLLKVLNRLMGG